MAPWNKDPGPLAKSTKECELLKKKVDALVKECNKVIGNKKLKDKETKLDQLYQNCLDNRKLVDNQNENFENLKEEDEQTKVKNYDQKKTQEVNKLSAMKVILNETLTKLLPDTTEEDFIKKHKQAEDKEDDEVKEKDEKEEEKGNKAGAKPVDDEEDEEEEDDDEEEEDDEDEEEDDDEEEEDEEEESKKPSARPTRVPSGAASKHDDEEDDEEEETEEEDDEDEEDDEEEEDEEERPVPAKRGADSRTKKKREEEDDDEKDEDEEEEDDDDDEEDDEEDDDEEDEDEEEDDDRKKLVKGDDKSKKVDTSAKKKKGADKKEEDVEVTQQTLHKFEAIDDYDAEEEGDLMFTKGTVLTVLETREDGWWMAENDAGEKGLVPSTYLQKYNPYEGVQHKDDGDEEDDDDDEQDEDDDDEDMSPRASQRIDTKTKKNKEKENYVEKDDDDEEDDDEDEDYWEHDDKKKLIKGDNKKPKKVGKSAKKKKGADKKYKYKEVKQQTKYNKCEDVLYKDALDHVVLQPSVSPVKKDEYEDEEEDDDDEEEEDDDEEKEKDKEIIQHKFEAIDDLDSEEKEDLKLTKGTIVTILKTREDGWWMVKNEAGKKGLVPSTYLKKFNPFEDVQYKDVLDPATIRPSVLPVKKDEDEKEEEDDDDEEEEADDDDEEDKEEDDCDVEEEEEEEEDDEIIQHKFEAIDDLDSEEKEDLKLTKGTIVTVLKTREDGWWMVENEEGKKGLVPSTFLKKYIPCEDAQHKDDLAVVQLPVLLKKTEDISDEKMSKKLWGSLRKAVQDTTVSDVLHAMGAVPSGFRKSTLSRKFNEGDQYRLSNYLIPKLSQSNLMYSDLFFEPSTSKIRLRSTRNERVITIVSCQQIPPPGAGVEVEGRHIKMCLFDGQQILSNIHSVTVASVDKSQRSWAFSTRTADNMDPFSHAEVFFRSNNTTSNIGILFELCISYSRVSTSEKGEFSCGWVHLPMFDVNGTATPNKSYDLYVNGGTPYEKGIEVDPAISRRTSSSALASLISGNKQPRLVVKLSQPKQQHKELMDTLPDTVMGATTLLPLYSYYRCCLADTLLRDRLDLDSTELIHSPLLKQFPKIADTPDLMKLFRTSWFEKLKDVRRAEKRDEEYMKEVFRQVFMDSVYPVQHVATLPAYRMGDEDNDKIRQETLVRYNETRRGNKSALATLLSPNMVFHPMILDEVAYSVIGPSCLNKPHSVS